MKNTDARSRGDWQGMNWIRQEKRLAIYLRDGCSCVWCGLAVEDDDVKLTLDHVVPHSKNGSNHESNLVTACHRCNTLRSNRDAKAFAKAVAQYINNGVKASDIIKHVVACSRRPLEQYKQEAAKLIERRGSAFKALRAM